VRRSTAELRTELLASDVIEDCAYTVAIERYRVRVAQWLQPNSGLHMCIGVRADNGELCTATLTSSSHSNKEQRHERRSVCFRIKLVTKWFSGAPAFRNRTMEFLLFRNLAPPVGIEPTTDRLETDHDQQ
jgi:hypothetical protein